MSGSPLSLPTRVDAYHVYLSPYFLFWTLNPSLWSPLQDPMVYMNDKSPLVSHKERPLRATAGESLIYSSARPVGVPVSAL